MDTIFALSSGGLPAGIAVVRISGPGTLEYLLDIGIEGPEPGCMTYARIREPETGELLDRGIVVRWAAPRSYTGEDVAELHLHGAPITVRGVIDSLAKRPGFRPAEPGEFSRRAFANGKMDLTAAEGLADLMGAETAMQRRQALAQSGGALSRKCEEWREALIGLMAQVEGELDFSDEGDVGGVDRAALGRAVTELAADVAAVAATAPSGERVREGLRIAVVGPPNAGKSSLVNALARRDISIVTDEAGTTRDVVEARLDIEGYPVQVFDTAGLRLATGMAEQEGVRRARAAADTADLVLCLGDRVQREEGAVAVGPVRAPVWQVLTKCDLDPTGAATSGCDGETLRISVVSGAGLDSLVKRLSAFVGENLWMTSGAVVSRARQAAALARVQAALRGAGDADLPLELVAEQLRLAVHGLGDLSGRIGVEDVLDRLFATFCIGK